MVKNHGYTMDIIVVKKHGSTIDDATPSMEEPYFFHGDCPKKKTLYQHI